MINSSLECLIYDISLSYGGIHISLISTLSKFSLSFNRKDGFFDLLLLNYVSV